MKGTRSDPFKELSTSEIKMLLKHLEAPARKKKTHKKKPKGPKKKRSQRQKPKKRKRTKKAKMMGMVRDMMPESFKWEQHDAPAAQQFEMGPYETPAMKANRETQQELAKR